MNQGQRGKRVMEYKRKVREQRVMKMETDLNLLVDECMNSLHLKETFEIIIIWSVPSSLASLRQTLLST